MRTQAQRAVTVPRHARRQCYATAVAAAAARCTGSLLIACEWPNAGIELSTATISAELLHQAANRARTLWPPPDVPDWPGSPQS